MTPTDGPKLVAYLKQRTLTDVDQNKILETIRRFGADDFETRHKASSDIQLAGSAAKKALTDAENDPDPEIALRATMALQKLEKFSHASSTAAAVRAIIRLKPEGAGAALIGYLPLADNEAMADEIRRGLAVLAYPGGKADPQLLAVLADKSAVRRGGALVALIDGAPQPRDIPLAVAEAVRREADPDTKFCGLWSMVTAARAKEFMPDLLDTIPSVGRGRIWQLEDLLIQIAGANPPPDGRFGKSPESLASARTGWKKWWTKNEAGIDLVKLNYKARIAGLTDIIEMDYRGFNQGRVVCLGHNLKEIWKITGVNNPLEARVLPNGNVLLAEQNFNRVTERDPAGKIVHIWTHIQPCSMEPLPNGGILIIGRTQIVEYDKDAKPVFTYPGEAEAPRRPQSIMPAVGCPTARRCS